MSWSPLLPDRAGNISEIKPAVAASVTAGAGKQRPKLRLMLRGAKLPVAWLATSCSVEVLIGHAEHEGMLRIQPAGPFRLGKVGLAVPEDRAVQIKLPVPPGIKAGPWPMTPVEFDAAADRIELRLPARWRNGSPPKPAAAPPAPTPTPPAPLTGNATPPARAAQLAAAAAEMARRKAGGG